MGARPDPRKDPPREDGGGWVRRPVPPTIRDQAWALLMQGRRRWRLSLSVGLFMTAALGMALAVSCAPRRAAPPPVPVYTPVSITSLPGWTEDRLIEARAALARTCGVLLKRDPASPLARGDSHAVDVAGSVAVWQTACRRLAMVSPDDSRAFRAFLEGTFQGLAVLPDRGQGQGLFTGYYEAHIRASRERGGPYQVPVHGVPDDLVTVEGKGWRLVDGETMPYHDRAAIEDGALEGVAPVLFWADDPVDLHILHIQGSGQVSLADGGQTRIGYAANNGQPFVGIGRLVRERGLAYGGSMPAIRDWLRANPEAGRALMRENPRYIFFREITGDGPIGAMGLPLEPLRSLAVDPAVIPLGALVWLDTVDPDGRPLRRLMVAQDTGSAIKGVVRGDVFWGAGEAAFHVAGRMKRPGRYYLLVPRGVNDTLRLM